MTKRGPVLVTGAAGFIGMHLALKLLEAGRKVVGLDNLDPYYDVQLKKDRLARLQRFPDFEFKPISLCERAAVEALFDSTPFEAVVNLAAQAGVRHSLSAPHSYVESNILGFLNILEGCRHHSVSHLVFASSSSVYGANGALPFSVHHNVDHPVSLYAATKKSDELMAHTYASLYGLPCTGLRFFTVYGPWGRPDMALFIFTKAILEGRPISVFNHGNMQRDFTYIDDIVEGTARVIDNPPEADEAWDRLNPDPGTSYAPYRVYNIGNDRSVRLMDFIETIEECVGKKARKNFMEMQLGDVPASRANIDDLGRDFGFRPSTPLKEGIAKFIAWYREYYKV